MLVAPRSSLLCLGNFVVGRWLSLVVIALAFLLLKFGARLLMWLISLLL